MGKSFGSNHSFLYIADIGYSDVAMRYNSSSSAFPVTLYNWSSKSDNCAVSAIQVFFMKNGVWTGV